MKNTTLSCVVCKYSVGGFRFGGFMTSLVGFAAEQSGADLQNPCSGLDQRLSKQNDNFIWSLSRETKNEYESCRHFLSLETHSCTNKPRVMSHREYQHTEVTDRANSPSDLNSFLPRMVSHVLLVLFEY